MNAHADVANEYEDHWYVRLPAGQVVMMTLDEMDTAFNEGRVAADTYVVEVGGDDWRTLGEVAGLDGSDDEEADEIEPDGEPEALAAPDGSDDEVTHVLGENPIAMQLLQRGPAPMRSAQPTMQYPYQPVQAAPLAMRPVAHMPAQQMAPQQYPPQQMAPQQMAPQQMAPQQMSPYGYGAAGMIAAPARPGPISAPVHSVPPNSMAPFVADIPIPDAGSFDDVEFAPRRGAKKFVVGSMFLAAFGALIAAGTWTGGAQEAPAAAAAPPAAQLLELKPRDSEPADEKPTASKPADEKEEEEDDAKPSDSKSRFSDAARAALLKADEERAAKTKVRRSSGGGGGGRAKSSSQSGDIKGSSHAYDPLNGAL